MKKEKNIQHVHFKKITILALIISIIGFCIVLAMYYKSEQHEFPGRDTDITCLDMANNIAYVYATNDPKTMRFIKYHMEGLQIPCSKSSLMKYQFDDKSKIMFAFYSAIDKAHEEEQLSVKEIISNNEPLGASIAIKTYFIGDNYYQVKFIDRFFSYVQAMSCQYTNYRFDCYADGYKPILFDCPKTEEQAKQKLSSICTPSPTNIIK